MEKSQMKGILLCTITASDHKIINIQNKYDDVDTKLVVVEIRVGLAMMKAMAMKSNTDAGLLGARALTKAIECTSKAIKKRVLAMHDESLELNCVNFLTKNAIEECSLHVQVPNSPTSVP